jgi:SPP1 gp7 family putative phage head morphogenesis protein
VALLTQDAAAQRILASGIDDVLVGLQAIGDALQAEINALGPDVQPWQIERLDRLRALEEQALRELDDYGQTLNSLLPVAQTNAAAAGAAAASASVQAVAGQAVVASSFRTLSAPALREIIAATSTGPLRDLLDTFGATGSAVLRQTLLDGIGQGRNARVVGDAIQRAVGVSRQRAQVIARTEILRAGKQANLASFAANANLISGWEWHAFKGPRTCSACLIMDGTEFPTSVTFFPGHPQCRCVGKPILRDYPQPKGQTGRDYLESLPEADQRRLLGNGKYDAWQSGELELDDMVAPRYSDQWGTSYQEASLATSQANAAVRRASGVAGTPVPTPTPAPASVAPQVIDPIADARRRIAAGEDPGLFVDTIIDDALATVDDLPIKQAALQQAQERFVSAEKAFNNVDKEIREVTAKLNAGKLTYEEQSSLGNRRNRLLADFKKTRDAVSKAKDDLSTARRNTRPTSQTLLRSIRKVMPEYGTSTARMTFSKASAPKAVEAFGNASEYFPNALWEYFVSVSEQRAITTNVVRRARFGEDISGLIIDVSGSSKAEKIDTALHELWHLAEYLDVNIVRIEEEFFTRRAKAPNIAKARQIARKINGSEFGVRDDFIDPYVGKVYRDRSYEVATMAMQSLFGTSAGTTYDVWGDIDHVRWFLQLLLRES